MAPKRVALPTGSVPIVLSGEGIALILGMMLGAAMATLPDARAQPETPSEYQVKAVFLYNFAKFVEWPQDPSEATNSPLVIGIIGDDPFGGALEQTVRGKSVRGHALVIRHFSKPEDARASQIVFISSSERSRLRSVLDSLKGASVLTVGDMEGFAHLGGVINFILEDNYVHFEINVEVAERAGLKLSSKLLSLAKIVRSDGSTRKG